MKNFINISTSFLRVLPNYLIIGAQKTGTSSLFNYLSMHPQVINSNKKEVHYFDKNFERPLNWYKQFFPFKFIANNYTIGEATPDYLYHPFVAQRIYNTIPGVKLIIILRNPVERVISHYFQAVRKNNEQRPIMQALIEEDKDEIFIFNELKKINLLSQKTYTFYTNQGVAMLNKLNGILIFFQENKSCFYRQKNY